MSKMIHNFALRYQNCSSPLDCQVIGDCLVCKFDLYRRQIETRKSAGVIKKGWKP